jgi:ABC-type uncharacterized transport system ATPase subunit
VRAAIRTEAGPRQAERAIWRMFHPGQRSRLDANSQGWRLAMIDVLGLRKSHGNQAVVHGVSFDVAEGEIFGIR